MPDQTDQEDLWGELPNLESIRLPLVILREQAAKLANRTNRVVQGEVVVESTSSFAERAYTRRGDSEPFNIDSSARMDLVVPALNDYRYTLLRMLFLAADPYPVILIRSKGTPESVVCHDESEFRSALKEILTAPETMTVVAALLKQAQHK